MPLRPHPAQMKSRIMRSSALKSSPVPPVPARSTQSQIRESDLWRDLSWHTTLDVSRDPNVKVFRQCKRASQTSPPHQTRYQTPFVQSFAWSSTQINSHPVVLNLRGLWDSIEGPASKCSRNSAAVVFCGRPPTKSLFVPGLA